MKDKYQIGSDGMFYLNAKPVRCCMAIAHAETCGEFCAAFEKDPDGSEVILHCCKREIVIYKGE